MIKKLFVLIAILMPVLAFSQKNDKPEVYLVGVVHAMHFDPDKHYSIIDLQRQVEALKPDLVCGEITPEAFGQPMEGYYPPEAAFLAEMADKLNYRFVAVDWRLDNATQSLANSQYPPEIKEKRSVLLNRTWSKMAADSSPSVYDFIHDKETLQTLDTLYENIICTNALSEIATGNWNERNRRIVENGLAAMKDADRVVFVFGVDHLPQLQRYLRAAGIEAKIPERLFTPSNDNKVPDAVRARWERNKENLIMIRDKKLSATYDDYQKVKNSQRIKDLELALEKSQ